MTDAKKQPIVISRENLYAQVWSTPMRQLADQFGITGTGLAKICARLDVPCPPRGYWAKKAAGKPVIQFRLPEPKAETPPIVRIAPTPPPVPPAPINAERQQQIDAAKRAHADLTVPDELKRPHPVIAGWLAEHKTKAQEAKRERDPHRRRWMEPPPYTETDHRQHRLLDTLFKALERLGFVIKTEQYGAVYLETQNERVDFQLREKQKQVRRPLTDEEKCEPWNRDRRWMRELELTGMLIFTIKTRLDAGMRIEWKDDPDRPLESRLPDIVATLSLAGPILAKQRQEREEAEQRRREEEYKRFVERQDREQDQKRWQCFLQLARQCDKAASARRLLLELETRLQDENERFGELTAREWLDWGRRWLDRYDPLRRRPTELYEHLANTSSYTSIEEWAWVRPPS